MRRAWAWMLERWRARGNGRRIAERIEQLETRLAVLEARWAPTAEAEQCGAVDVEDGDAVWDGVGVEPRALGADAESLAKAASEGGSGGGGPVSEVGVVPGVPQGLPGQQARRRAARLWEGVV